MCRSRLLKRPSRKTPIIRTLLRKERKAKRRLKHSEKLLLSLCRTQRNTLEVTCLVCKNKIKVFCHLPEDMKKPVAKGRKTYVKGKQKQNHEKIPGESTVPNKKKKKKKKKKKELKAGLLITSHMNEKTSEKDTNGEATRPSGKKMHREEKDATHSESLEIGGMGYLDTNPEQNLTERLAGSVVARGNSSAQNLLTSKPKNTHKTKKDQSRLTTSLKSKMARDAAMDSKNDNALHNFLSSLI